MYTGESPLPATSSDEGTSDMGEKIRKAEPIDIRPGRVKPKELKPEDQTFKGPAGGSATGSTRTDTGNTANARPTRKDGHVGAKARVKAEHEWIELRRPHIAIRWVLSNGRLFGHRFTPFQWAVLVARYPRCPCGCGRFEPARSSVMVGEILNMTGKSRIVLGERRAAESIVFELYHDWLPAYRKWQRIKAHGSKETLTPQEKAVLAKHRKRGTPKKGRRTPEFMGVPEPYEDVADTWTDKSGVVRSRAVRSSQLTPKQQRELGWE